MTYFESDSEERALARVSKDGRKTWTRSHPSRRGEDAAPQDDVGDNFRLSGLQSELMPFLVDHQYIKQHDRRQGQDHRPDAERPENILDAETLSVRV
jgi:hypothetical protein